MKREEKSPCTRNHKTGSKTVPSNAVKLNEIEVDPHDPNFPTGIDVEAGVAYLFLAEGCWKDWFKVCGPNGWGPRWNPLTCCNRIRWQPFFLLCGNIGKDDTTAFGIGDREIWRATPEVSEREDRQLYLFANDWKKMYWNNHALKPEQGGPLKVTIFRLQQEEG